MASLTNEEIEQLQKQLKEKQKEFKEIYNKLVEAGAMEVPDDFLDTVAGGYPGSPKTTVQTTVVPSFVPPKGGRFF